jgi:fatty-acyl-CoA synthase
MQNWPLTVDKIMEHAARVHGAQAVVSRQVDGTIHRSDYASVRARSRQVSAALLAIGVQSGDRIATLAWNSTRHLECWYGTMGIGAVLHTLNPRLHIEQLVWIANNAGGKILFLDQTFLKIIEPVRDRLPYLHYVVIDQAPEETPEVGFALPYEDWIDQSVEGVSWGGFDENSACGLCYTSGTTGDPKGVLYSHRSNVLHAMMETGKGVLAIGSSDVVLPLVPMFHANAWGMAFACPLAGAKLVLPGRQLDGDSVYALLDSERVTISAGVPTVWLALLEHVRKHGLKLPYLERVMVGGAALPPAILEAFENELGTQVISAWGMTETSPVGTISGIPEAMLGASPKTLVVQKLKQGRPPFGVELQVADEDGRPVPSDGMTPGRLLVRGFAVASAYLNQSGKQILDSQGYFDTGDIATIDSFGAIQITDRAKDLIKSGGEWISSIEIENIILSHPDVALAAAIGVPHPKWDERPVLFVELRPGSAVSQEMLKVWLENRIARWWMPEAIIFVESLTVGPTGKVNKLLLRKLAEQVTIA